MAIKNFTVAGGILAPGAITGSNGISGDMDADIYDPQLITGDAFLRSNHSGNIIIASGEILSITDSPSLLTDATNKGYVDTAIANGTGNGVERTGDTMTGALVLNADPILALGASTKQYVDSSVSTLQSTSLDVTGDTMTGALVLNADPILALGASTKQYVDSQIGSRTVESAGDTMTGALVLNADPIVSLGASTKQYVDSQIGTRTVDVTGDTMTGALVLNADPILALGASTKQYVDSQITTLEAASVDLNGDVMTGALVLNADPSQLLGAATKQYVDASVPSGVEFTANKNIVGGYAGLDGAGLINSAQLPLLAITSTFVVASELAQLALTVQEGDVAVRSDLNVSYIALNATNGTIADWQQLLTPTDVVLSVAGKTGAVTLASTDLTDSATLITTTGGQTISGNLDITNVITADKLIIGANGVANETDVFLTDNANIAATQNMNFYIDSTNLSTTKQFTWYKNASATSGATELMKLTENGELTIGGAVAATLSTIQTFTSNKTFSGNLTITGALSGNQLSGTTDIDTLLDGLYDYAGQTLSGTLPNNGNGYGHILQVADSTQSTQLYFGGSNNSTLSVRRRDNGVWNAWTSFLDSSNNFTKTSGTTEFTTNSSTPVVFKGGTADSIYVPLYADVADQNNRTGYMGYPTPGDRTLFLNNSAPNADISIIPTGTAINAGVVKLGANSEVIIGRGHGLASDASDIYITGSGIIAAQDYMYFNVDSTNSLANTFFSFRHDGETSNSPEVMRLTTDNGELKLNDGFANFIRSSGTNLVVDKINGNTSNQITLREDGITQTNFGSSATSSFNIYSASTSRTEFSIAKSNGDVYFAGGTLSLGSSTTSGSATVINFKDANTNTARSLQWNNANNRFEIENNAGVTYKILTEEDRNFSPVVTSTNTGVGTSGYWFKIADVVTTALNQEVDLVFDVKSLAYSSHARVHARFRSNNPSAASPAFTNITVLNSSEVNGMFSLGKFRITETAVGTFDIWFNIGTSYSQFFVYDVYANKSANAATITWAGDTQGIATEPAVGAISTFYSKNLLSVKTDNNTVRLGDFALAGASGNRFGVIPTVDVTGNMEVGYGIHFHGTDGDVEDYDALARVINGNAIELVGKAGADNYTNGDKIIHSGTAAQVIAGRLTLSKATDATGTSPGDPAFIIGNVSGTHLEFDSNEILCKNSSTTTAGLHLQTDGGDLFVGNNLTTGSNIVLNGKEVIHSGGGQSINGQLSIDLVDISGDLRIWKGPGSITGNMGIGGNSLGSLTTGDNNIAIGYDAGTSLSPVTITTQTGVVCLGNNNVTELYCKTSLISTSDKRDKADIKVLGLGLDFINKMKPVTYVWNHRSDYLKEGDTDIALVERGTEHKKSDIELGFIAQDVREIELAEGWGKDRDHQLIAVDTPDGKSMAMKYDRIVPVLVNAIQELTARLEKLEKK